MLVTHAKHRQPIISFAELMLPLPASRELWLAPDPISWQSSYSRIQPDFGPHEASVHRVSAEEDLHLSILHGRDRALVVGMKLCSIAAQVWNYQQMRSLSTSGCVSADPSNELWTQARLQKL